MSVDAIAVIMAGGSGKRLWPLSNEKHPKQLSSEIFDGTLLNEAIKRAEGVFPKENIFVLTTKELEQVVKDNCDHRNILVQPLNADTAAAFLFSAIYFNHHFPGKAVVSLFSDHLIKTEEKFKEAISNLVSATKKYPLISLGSIPNYPETNFGYIKVANEDGGVFDVQEYIEKPLKLIAQELVRDDAYLWNTGYFGFISSRLIKVFQEIDEEFTQSLIAQSESIVSNDPKDEILDIYKNIDAISFERMIVENYSDLKAVKTDMQWMDIGNWDSLYDLSEKDAERNVIFETDLGRVVVESSSRNIIFPGDNEVAIIGINNTVIANVDNKLLVCNRDKIGRIKHVIKGLDKKN